MDGMIMMLIGLMLLITGSACGMLLTHIFYITYFHTIILPKVDEITKSISHMTEILSSKIDFEAANDVIRTATSIMNIYDTIGSNKRI